MTDKQCVEALIAEAENRIKEITGHDAKLNLFLTVQKGMEHELALQACAIWQVDIAEIKMRNRKQEITAKRQLLACLLKQRTLFSLKQIAMQIGYTDHSDVLHGMRKVKDNLDINDPLTVEYLTPIKHLFIDEKAI